MELDEAILMSMISINGGWANGGKVIGLARAIEYLVELAQDGETDRFVESYASLSCHLVWVDTPGPVAARTLQLVTEALRQNGIAESEVLFLVEHSHDRVTKILEEGAAMTPNGFFMRDDGSIVEGEQLLGLQGVQFIEDVSALTMEDVAGGEGEYAD